MDDRAVGILENYDLKVLRTWKGRGSILFETNRGTGILKEYMGPPEKVQLQDKLLLRLRETGFPLTDVFERNKEGEIITYDNDKKAYIVKEYFAGKECNIWDTTECAKVLNHLGNMQKSMEMNTDKECILLPVFSLEKECEKHNKELKRIRNYIRGKGQKTDFEIYLMKHYDYFYQLALDTSEKLKETDWASFYEGIKVKGSLCHGDYQHHNILMNPKGIAVINFEKYIQDSRIRDLYLFMRKVLEKNNWLQSCGQEMVKAYEQDTPLTEMERKQLYFRLLYPEKFWKIVNFYYNSGKAWLPMCHMEKLQKVINQEESKKRFLDSFL